MTTIETLETIRDNLLEGNMTLTAVIVDTVITDFKTLTASLAEVTREYAEFRGMSGTTATRLKDQITTLETENKGSEIRLMIWSATFQRYQSWKANGTDPRDYPDAVVSDYLKCSQFDNKALTAPTEITNGESVKKRQLDAVYAAMEAYEKRMTGFPQAVAIGNYTRAILQAIENVTKEGK